MSALELDTATPRTDARTSLDTTDTLEMFRMMSNMYQCDVTNGKRAHAIRSTPDRITNTRVDEPMLPLATLV
jgi:hypothetical protein